MRREVRKGYFVNGEAKPSFTAIETVVGRSKDKWTLVFELLRASFRFKASFNYHGPVTGWVIEFHKSRKLRVILIPDKDVFRIFFPRLEANGFDVDERMNEPGIVKKLTDGISAGSLTD